MSGPAIVLHYFDSCPSWRVADARLREVIAELGLDAEVRYLRVESQQQAEELGFLGSPSILIDGRDPFRSDSQPAGWSCRLYETEAGLEGAPSKAQLRRVLGATR